MRILPVVIFTLCIVLSVAETRKRQAKPCSTSAECGMNQCCLSPVVSRGRRQAGGYCTARGSQGNKCYIQNDLLVAQHSSTVYFNACPCLNGQHCEGTGQIEVPQGEIGQCEIDVRGKREGGPCSTYKECAADECCVSNIQPVGKKKRAISILSGGGTCQKLGQSGDSCLVRITTLTEMSWACPCASGLTCKGLGFFEIPQGERGTCT